MFVKENPDRKKKKKKEKKRKKVSQFNTSQKKLYEVFVYRISSKWYENFVY